jgi:spore maturation protein CgeB
MGHIDQSRERLRGLGKAVSQVVVHLVGAQNTNYPWSFEDKIADVMTDLGIRVISTDFRQERKRLHQLLSQKADLLLVCKGDWISPRLIQSVPIPKTLWYAEYVGRGHDPLDYATAKNRRVLAYNGSVFDYVFSHDQSSLGVYRKLGCRRVGWLPTAAVYPRVHSKLDVPKEHDVVFVGTQTPRRARILLELSKYFQVHMPQVWDAVELNELLNRSRIVLNIHASEVLNTETRLCEALGAGAFLLSEEISCPDMFEDGQHLVYWRQGQVDELMTKIDYYLNHEKEREKIARSGHAYALEHHTLEKRIDTLLSTVIPEKWPGRPAAFVRETARRGRVAIDTPESSDSCDQLAEAGSPPRTLRTIVSGWRADLWTLSELLKLRLKAAEFETPRWLRRPRWLR